jgi:hypothetical protein
MEKFQNIWPRETDYTSGTITSGTVREQISQTDIPTFSIYLNI